ncbi:periodic tryptophan protein 1 homolog [Strongylocentrotus purpuratus]|uniref:Periodic tryptophan protein 1 homolog n=1 Tax=Strongylocentrotus purpuratus TaxID=7668 RepID=A0A7M7P0D4_STRPU|nr:periodic tryptophan protein 1 homolog [Strongylocentrotus purpuratus]XP_030844344.1 periodic tryptophan protein 1 homolog [Strongylocentrotus purpuratus]
MASTIVTSLAWVRRGVAKAVPDKIELSKDELKLLIDEGQRSLGDLNLNDDDGEEDDEAVTEDTGDGEWEDVEGTEGAAEGAGGGDAADKFYKMDDYDEEPDIPDVHGSGFHNFAVYADNNDDPYITLKEDREEMDEREDTNIKPTDNMIVIGKALEDFTNLEVYVYNEEEGVLYVHHDVLLSSFPLALEWLNFDPLEQQPGNLIAVGNMTPVIDVWDLDIMNAVEPAFSLGKKFKKKSKQKPTAPSLNGHIDAVLDLSWNRHLGHGLASASADESILLWDMSQTKAISLLQRHTDKVQTVEWHPFEMQSLLSGGFDGRINVYDCRSEDSFKTWTVEGEIERVLWNHFQPYNFLASTDKGYVYNYDIRTDKPLFTLHAHEKATTGISLSHTVPDLLVTCSADNSYKVWDTQDNKPGLVVSKDPKMGIINSAIFCPESPFLVAMGGERDSLRLMDLSDHAPVVKRFADRQREPVLPHPSEIAYKGQSSQEGEADAATAEADTMETASETSSTTSSKSGKRKRKKKKKTQTQEPSD